MSKIKLKMLLIKNHLKEEQKELLGIKKNKDIIFFDDKIKVDIKIDNCKLVMKRSSSEYELIFTFDLMKKTKLNYNIYNLSNLSMDLMTTKLELKDNEININYKIDNGLKVLDFFEFYLKWEDIL